MVKIGSVLVIIILLFILWSMLSLTSLFSKIGQTVLRKKDSFKERASADYKHDK